MFTLLDSDSYDDSDGIGCYCFFKKMSVQYWTYVDSYSDANGYCTQFDTDISTNKVIFKVIFHIKFVSESS